MRIILLDVIFKLYYDGPKMVYTLTQKIDNDQVIIPKAAAKFNHSSGGGWCSEKEDHLIKVRANWNENRDGTSCPSYVHEVLKGIPNNSMLFVLGDSLTRKPIELLCSSCGVHSCNLWSQNTV